MVVAALKISKTNALYHKLNKNVAITVVSILPIGFTLLKF